jgi:hypothetical protein
MVVALLALALALALAWPAWAGGGEMTQGSLHTYAAGLERGYTITGQVVMLRAVSDMTRVSVHAAGLAPNTPYPVHVHNRGCGDANAGGHYQHVPGGPVNAVNQIWPGFTTNTAGIGNGKAVNAFRARPEAQSVVIHDTDGARIACADLLP